MTKTKVQFASTAKVAELHEEMSQLLWHVALIMKEPEESEHEWLSYTFVSDESRIVDFLFEDSELIQLHDLTGIPDLEMLDLLCDVALRLRRETSDKRDRNKCGDAI